MNWIKVEDRLPEPNTRCAVHITDVALICLGTAYYDGNKFLFDATMLTVNGSYSKTFEKASDLTISVTHWCEIEPPKE